MRHRFPMYYCPNVCHEDSLQGGISKWLLFRRESRRCCSYLRQRTLFGQSALVHFLQQLFESVPDRRVVPLLTGQVLQLRKTATNRNHTHRRDYRPAHSLCSFNVLEMFMTAREDFFLYIFLLPFFFWLNQLTHWESCQSAPTKVSIINVSHSYFHY